MSATVQGDALERLWVATQQSCLDAFRESIAALDGTKPNLSDGTTPSLMLPSAEEARTQPGGGEEGGDVRVDDGVLLPMDHEFGDGSIDLEFGVSSSRSSRGLWRRPWRWFSRKPGRN